MANIFCPTPFQPCVDPADPISNFSSEDPDQDLFIARNYGGTFHGGGGGFRFSSPSPGPGAPPPLSGGGSADSGNGGTFFQCEALTQEEADLCAYNGQFQALNNSWGAPQTGPFGDGDWGNNAQTAMAACGTTATVPANTFFLGSQALADAQALKYAQQLAVNKQSCFNVSQSCTVECADGTPFTSTVEAGICSGFTAAIANQIAHTIACNSAVRDQICFSELFQDVVCTGTNYTADINATGGQLTMEISSGSLPPGIDIFSAPGADLQLSGVPTTAGDYTFTVRGTNAAGQSAEKTYTITVKEISPSSIPDAQTGVTYSQQFTFIGATGAVTWSLGAGNIPGGLSLSADGLLSGIPDPGTQGPWIIEVVAQDDATTCTLGIPLTVQQGDCPDWDTMVWVLQPDPAVENNVGTVTQSYSGGAFTCVGDSPAFVDPGDYNGVEAGAIGTMSYTGGGCECNLHFDLVNVSNLVADETSGIIVEITAPFMQLLQFFNVVSGVTPTGTYNVTFTVPDTLGVAITLRVTISVTTQTGVQQDAVLVSFTNGLITNI